jgi:hypothetical protein
VVLHSRCSYRYELSYLCMAKRELHLFHIKVDRTGILYVARFVCCSATDSHMNEVALVHIHLKYSTQVVRFWCVRQRRNYSHSGILRFAVCVCSIVGR